MSEIEYKRYNLSLPLTTWSRVEQRAKDASVPVVDILRCYIEEGLARDTHGTQRTELDERVKRLASVVDVMVHDVDSLTQKVKAIEKERGEL